VRPRARHALAAPAAAPLRPNGSPSACERRGAHLLCGSPAVPLQRSLQLRHGNGGCLARRTCCSCPQLHMPLRWAPPRPYSLPGCTCERGKLDYRERGLTRRIIQARSSASRGPPARPYAGHAGPAGRPLAAAAARPLLGGGRAGGGVRVPCARAGHPGPARRGHVAAAGRAARRARARVGRRAGARGCGSRRARRGAARGGAALQEMSGSVPSMRCCRCSRRCAHAAACVRHRSCHRVGGCGHARLAVLLQGCTVPVGPDSVPPWYGRLAPVSGVCSAYAVRMLARLPASDQRACDMQPGMCTAACAGARPAERETGCDAQGCGRPAAAPRRRAPWRRQRR